LSSYAARWQRTADEKDAPHMASSTKPVHTNRLIDATSPYLLQHAHNPVDWYEWGSAALEKAKREDKPIFLSVGYSACHWCHVMAHESFENEQIAALMNKHFVNIKVDREERPDLDEIYMQATMLLNQGQGGWPMSVWLTPDRKPFFAGTYFPPTSKWGRPGFGDLCERIGELWRTKREAVEADAERLTGAVARSLRTPADPDASLTLDTIDRTVQLLAGVFDHGRGGVISGGSNKFPPSMALDLFLRTIARGGTDEPTRRQLRELVELTLDRMARGGIYDQLGGGIHRYSTDVDWLVPHFEKMLYDQALVSRIYIDAYQFTHKPLYARIAREIFDYVIHDLQSPEGGFYSTRDADSEDEEGKYYVWTKQEILAVLGQEAGELFCSYYDVSESGNWNDPHAPGVPKNILHVPRNLETVAKLNKIDPQELEKRLAASRRKLLDAGSKRVPPRLDDKILAEWNGLMIASLARGGAVLDEQKYIEAAAQAADFILTRQYDNGRLLRAYRDGRKLEAAFLTDYACMIEGLIELYEATFDWRWLDRAVELNKAAIEHFYDEHDGGFFFSADDHEQLIARSKDIRDGATPSGNSVQLMNLLRLSVMLGDEKLRTLAEETMNYFAARITQYPGTGERFLAAVEFALAGPVELAVVGDPSDARTQALLKKVNVTYLPNRVLLLSNPADADKNVDSPLLENRPLVAGNPAVYVCRNYTCQRPAATPKELASQLRE
jgi:uncharacterized protein YyaL (SSP411 family)